MSTNKLSLGALAPALVASTASAQVLMFDFGKNNTTATGTALTNSPYHTVAGSGFNTNTTWNYVSTTDITTGIKFSDGTNASAVSVNVGGVSGSSTINLSSAPSFGSLGTNTNTGIYAGTSVGKDAIFFGSSNTQVGVQIGGLSAGTYDVYVTARNTNAATGSNANYTQTIYLGKQGAAGNFDSASYANATLSYATASDYTAAWTQGENYVKLSITLTAGEYLNLAVSGAGQQTRGFLNSVQIVSAIPEPSSFAALAGVFSLGVVALRRRRSR